MAISVRTGAAWVVSARAGREGHLSPLGGNLGENDSASWWKTTGAIALQRVGAASWYSLMFSLKLFVSLGALGTHVGPRLRKLSNGQPLVQGQLAAHHGQALAGTHFVPVRCVQNWGVVRGAKQAVTAGPIFLWSPR